MKNTGTSDVGGLLPRCFQTEGKKVFMKNYVLNRANTSINGCLEGEKAAQEALLAWNYIEKECEVSEPEGE